MDHLHEVVLELDVERIIEVELDSTGRRVLAVELDQQAKELGVSKGTMSTARQAMKVQWARVSGQTWLWIDPKDHPANNKKRKAA